METPEEIKIAPVSPLPNGCDALTPNNSRYRGTGAFCFLQKGHIGNHQWAEPPEAKTHKLLRKKRKKRMESKAYEVKAEWTPVRAAELQTELNPLLDPLDVLAEMRNVMKRLSVAQQKKMISILATLLES